ncbi:MAG: SpoIID/LytB domain-containing protein [Gallintestinimicrobium sp.]
MQSGSDVGTMTEEAFLIGALAAVIPAEYEPEALKAQAVILRSSCVAEGIWRRPCWRMARPEQRRRASLKVV